MGWLGSLFGGLFGGLGSLFGANEQADAAKYAANLQSQSAQQALEFAKMQSAQEQANFIAAQTANYGQWAAQQARLAPYQKLGAGASSILARGLGFDPSSVSLPALPAAPQFTNSMATPQNTAVPQVQPRGVTNLGDVVHYGAS